MADVLWLWNCRCVIIIIIIILPLSSADRHSVDVGFASFSSGVLWLKVGNWSDLTKSCTSPKKCSSHDRAEIILLL
jgi:hypothetical protein